MEKLMIHLNLRNLSLWFLIFCLGTLFVPFQIDVGLCGVDPITLGLIAAGSMAISSGAQWLIGKKQIEAAKDTNAENRAHDIQMLREEQNFNAEQVEKANLYNSPANQVARLRDAGLNPSVLAAQGGITSGLSSAASASGHSTPGQVPDYSGLSSAVNGLGSIAGSLVQEQLSPNSSVARQKTLNDIANDNARVMLQKYETEKNLHLGRAQYAETMEKVRRSQEDQSTLMNQVRSQTKMQEEQTKLLKLNQDYQAIVNRYAPNLNEAQLKQYQASCANLNASAAAAFAQGKLYSAETEKVLVEKAHQLLENENFVSLSAEQKTQIADGMTRTAINGADKLGFESDEARRYSKYGPWQIEEDHESVRSGIPQVHQHEQNKTTRRVVGAPSSDKVTRWKIKDKDKFH